MGLFGVLAAGFNFIKPVLKKIGAAVCDVTAYGISALGDRLSGSGSNDVLERSNRVLENNGIEDYVELKNKKEEIKAKTIEGLVSIGIPSDIASQMEKRIRNAVLDSQTVSTTGNIQMEVLNYSDDYQLTGDAADYLPITAYSFKNDIIQKLNKYNYVLPLFVYTEIKNTSEDNGIRLDCAVTTAYTNAWMKGDANEIMANLNPLSIDNKSTVHDLQSCTRELFETLTVKEAKERYEWLNNSKNLEILFSNRFTPEELHEDEKNEYKNTWNNPENTIALKETQREENKWIPYEIFRTCMNGIMYSNEMSDKTMLFTGYAIKPRDEFRNNDGTTEKKKCSISVRSSLIVLGLQNEENVMNKLLTNPTSIEIDLPINNLPINNNQNGEDEESKVIPYQDVQSIASKLTLAKNKYTNVANCLINKSDALAFNRLYKKKEEKNQIYKQFTNEQVITFGLAMNIPSRSDTGFAIREKDN